MRTCEETETYALQFWLGIATMHTMTCTSRTMLPRLAHPNTDSQMSQCQFGKLFKVRWQQLVRDDG